MKKIEEFKNKYKSWCLPTRLSLQLGLASVSLGLIGLLVTFLMGSSNLTLNVVVNFNKYENQKIIENIIPEVSISYEEFVETTAVSSSISEEFVLTEKAREILKKNAAKLISDSSIKAQINIQGSENTYDLALGEKRALATKKYLESIGINPNQIRYE